MVMPRAAMLRNKFYNEDQNSITDFYYPTGTAFVDTIFKPLLKDDGNLDSIAMQVGGFWRDRGQQWKRHGDLYHHEHCGPEFIRTARVAEPDRGVKPDDQCYSDVYLVQLIHQ
jgi:hypothetical protein